MADPRESAAQRLEQEAINRREALEWLDEMGIIISNQPKKEATAGSRATEQPDEFAKPDRKRAA